jgi:YD repeat-containing protein
LVFAPGVGLALATPLRAEDPIFDNKGFSRTRELISQLPFEHIDPMTGNVLLTFTDLELPGNAGFDLRIQRTYNSKIYGSYSNTGSYTLAEDSWAGAGWRLHFGRVHQHLSIDPGPVIEMPDGSRHPSYLHMDGSAAHFMTREHWTYENLGGLGRLRLPNGLTYFFGELRGLDPNVLYVSEISDPFGNRIVVKYAPSPAPVDAISSVEQQLVTGETRVVTFTYGDGGALATMTYKPPGMPTRVWTYTQSRLDPPYGDWTKLTEVQPPLGPPWTFEYQPLATSSGNPAPGVLAALTTPSGGRIDYKFVRQLFYYGSNIVYSPVLDTRTVSGVGIPAGNWQYDFDSPDVDEPVTAVVTGPCSKERYVTNALGPAADERPWAIGTLKRKETRALDDTVLQVEELDWQMSVPISNKPESNDSFQTHLPLLKERRVTRGGKTYRTTYVYDGSPYSSARASNFNDYGRANELLEDGENGALTRKTKRAFFYGSSTDPSFGTYIVDRLLSETVRVPATGSESFTDSYTYETTGGYKGFRKSQTIRGITTIYEVEFHAGKRTGNVKTSTDARGYVTSFDYAWGATKEIQTPEHTTTRVINPDGSIKSETRRGFTTSFEYDTLGRLVRRTPPVGNSTETAYDNETGRKVTVTRGPSTVTTTLDGFGRAIGTANNLSEPVKTKVQFDACGRTVFQSYPFTGNPTPAPGSTLAYDALGRTIQKSDPGDTSGTDSVVFSYPSGVNVDIKDENGRITRQTWAAFGDPEDKRLMSVRDPADKVTSYTYNTLGAIRRVTPPEAPERTWVYYAPGEPGGTPGLLKTETHPESGTVSYTYDAVGNVQTRTDVEFGTTTFTYDGNNRLRSADRPGDSYDTTFDYDESDNRRLLENGYVRSTFSFDGANRMTERKDELEVNPARTQVLTTGYQYDGNDRLKTLTYPSHSSATPRKVEYTYDQAGRILSVTKSGTSTTYASSFKYHPSGAPLSFKAGNGLTRTFDYTRRYRLKSIDSSLLKLGYEYEPNGNVRSIKDVLRPALDQGFEYDALDRLKTVTGAFAGSYSYAALGNRLTRTVGGNASFTYDDATKRLAYGTIDSVAQTWLYDDNGNLKTRKIAGVTAETYAYTPENMIETATVGDESTTYRYDGDNQRVSRGRGGTYHYFIRGPGGQLLSELTDSCSKGAESVRDYVYAGDRLLAILLPPAPEVALAAASASVTEKAGASVVVAIVLKTATGCPTQRAVTVGYSTHDGSALAGADYVAVSGSVTFPAGSPSGSAEAITVPLVNDTLIEPSEAFSFQLLDPSGAVLGSVHSETITIADNDTPAVSWTAAAASVLENGGSISLSARIVTDEGNPLSAAATVAYATANGTAKAPGDYEARSGTFTFAEGAASGSEQSVSVPIVHDTLVEEDETFRLSLSGPVAAKLGTPSTATITIVDVSPVVSLTTARAEVLETAGSVSLGVRLVTPDGLPTAVAVTVKYATANGSAKAPGDYGAVSGTLTFDTGTANGSEQVVTVPVVADTLVEADETFKLVLSGPTGAKLGTPSSTVVTIIDSSPVLSLTAASVAVAEGAGAVALNVRLVTLSGLPTVAPVTVKFATANGTAKAPADYGAVSGIFTFDTGTASGSEQVVSIPLIRDAVVEATETFRLVLSSPVGARLGAVSSTTISLLDVSPGVSFMEGSVEVVEDAGEALVPVQLTTPDEMPTIAPVTVKFKTTNLAAVAGKDFTATSGTVSFPAGAETGAIQYAKVPLLDDALSEDNEAFKLSLSSPTAARLGTPSASPVAILDDDPLPTVSIADATVTEPNSGSVGASFKLTLSAPAGRVVKVSYATSDGSAVAPADYKAKSGAVSFKAGVTSQTVSVSVVGDKVDEDNEAFLVSLSSPVNVELGRGLAQGTIVDNDGVVSFCQPIALLPRVIDKPGRYCLATDLTWDRPEGAAITIDADLVSIDLRGLSLMGGAGPETLAVGILAAGRSRISISNGRIGGFFHGIRLEETAPYTSLGGHLIERVLAEGNTGAGISVAGQSSVVRRCTVRETGGLGGEGEEGADTFGIAVSGPGTRLLENDVSGTVGNGIGVGHSLFVWQGKGTVAARNRLTGSFSAVGLTIRESQDVVAAQNRLMGLGSGIVYEGESTGTYRGNLTSGVLTPFSGGSDAGGNQ